MMVMSGESSLAEIVAQLLAYVGWRLMVARRALAVGRSGRRRGGGGDREPAKPQLKRTAHRVLLKAVMGLGPSSSASQRDYNRGNRPSFLSGKHELLVSKAGLAGTVRFIMLTGRRLQKVKPDPDRGEPHRVAADVAEALLARCRRRAPPGASEMDEPDRLFGAPAVRSGDFGDADRDLGARGAKRALCHRHRRMSR